MPTLFVDTHAAYHHLRRVFRDEVHPLQISLTEAVVLRLVDRNPHVSATSIRISTGLGMSTLSSLLGRLEKRGYLRRLPGLGDRRYRELVLTTTGRRVAEEAAQVLATLARDVAAYGREGSVGHVSQLADALAIIDQPSIHPRGD